MTLDPEEINKRAANIKLIGLDNDGVLTDCRSYISTDGSEAKSYNIKDGFGLVIGKRAGLIFAIITGAKSSIVEKHAQKYQITEVHQGFESKGEILKGIMDRNNLTPAQTAFIGDDIFDLPALKIVGLSAAPADAHEDVKSQVHWISKYNGGRGAVREFIELILKARGLWSELEKFYTA
ncbi:HAD hydrolase family protein [bacterium]|nr:HAD hydrolase family protein [bacterium]